MDFNNDLLHLLVEQMDANHTGCRFTNSQMKDLEMLKKCVRRIDDLFSMTDDEYKQSNSDRIVNGKKGHRLLPVDDVTDYAGFTKSTIKPIVTDIECEQWEQLRDADRIDVIKELLMLVSKITRNVALSSEAYVKRQKAKNPQVDKINYFRVPKKYVTIDNRNKNIIHLNLHDGKDEGKTFYMGDADENFRDPYVLDGDEYVFKFRIGFKPRIRVKDENTLAGVSWYSHEFDEFAKILSKYTK